MPPHAAAARFYRPYAYDYLMVSSPIVLRLSDGAELATAVTARATKRLDVLSFWVNGQIVSEAEFANPKKDRPHLRYEEAGFALDVRCEAYLDRTTYNHACRMYSDGKLVGKFDLNQRYYKKTD